MNDLNYLRHPSYEGFAIGEKIQIYLDVFLTKILYKQDQ